MNGESLDIQQTKIDQLKQLFPELFSEDKLDWEKLKAAFGDDINFNNERYVLNWAGKADAFKALQIPTTATLKPLPEESINFDTTENVFIEGENLEVLKVLQKAYHGKIKCIIIDPPYNTGSDSFIYPDSFKENKKDYEKRVGDKDEEGYLMKEGLFRKNSKDSGHFHSNWLSMMYPRLFLAKNLLRDDGVIFVHIDDNEVHNLRLLMNEIFGEENFIGKIIIQSNPRGSQSNKFMGIVHDYLLAFAKKIDEMEAIGLNLDERMKSEYDLDDGDGKKYRLLGLRQRGGAWRKEQRPSLFFPIYVNPGSGYISLDKNDSHSIEIFPIKPTTNEDGSWRWSKTKIKGNEHLLTGKQVKRNESFIWDIYQKDYLEDNNGEEKKTKTKTIWNEKDVNYQNGTIELKELFNGKGYFDFPKPVFLEKKIIGLSETEDEIILDFFGGSGTIAHSVLELNKEDKLNRRFIVVQLPELIGENTEAYKDGYKTISDITKERIKKVIQNIEKDKEEKPGLFDTANTDLGFKVFKLSTSNFKIWRGNEITEDNLVQQLDAFTEPVNEGSLEQNILFELMIKAGYLLTDKVEIKNKYYAISNGELIIALEEMTQPVIAEIIAAKPQKVITLDSLFEGNGPTENKYRIANARCGY